MAHAVEVRNTYTVETGKPEQKRPTERNTHSEKINVELSKVTCGGDWIEVA
jgi:hypothetical protein